MRFALRGLVEGFYGTPWRWDQRFDLLPRLAELGFNTYMYGPKDDQHVCLQWREPYDAASLGRLADFKDACDRVGIDLICMLAPCFTIVFTSDSDFRALMAKYAQLHGLGLRRFVLLFDDVPLELQDEQDRARFGNIINAHIDLALRVHRALKEMDRSIELIVCPTEYFGDGGRGYLGPFARALPSDVRILYTGPTICAHALTVDNAERFRALTGKKPLYWDNYPVNDANMTREFHIAPIIHRDSELSLHAEGLLVNPMEFMEASMLTLFTYGEYLNDGAGYDPEASYRRAVSHVLGEACYDAVSVLRELCYRSVLTRHGEQFPEDAPDAQRHDAFVRLVAEGDGRSLSDWAAERIKRLEGFSSCANKAFLEDSLRWRRGALRFLRAVQALDAGLLRQYLADDPEDIMLFEARALLDRLERGGR